MRTVGVQALLLPARVEGVGDELRVGRGIGERTVAGVVLGVAEDAVAALVEEGAAPLVRGDDVANDEVVPEPEPDVVERARPRCS